MKIEILYFSGCPNHEPTVQRVREVAQELGIDAELVLRDVAEVDDPAALGFRGSPTVLVEGREIEAAATEPTANLGCRTFSTGSGVPDRSLLVQAMTGSG